MASADNDYLREVCRIGQGAACCRYVVGGASGIECAKHDPLISLQLDRRADAGRMVARADNCAGSRNGKIPPGDSPVEIENGPLESPQTNMEGPVGRPVRPTRTR